MLKIALLAALVSAPLASPANAARILISFSGADERGPVSGTTEYDTTQGEWLPTNNYPANTFLRGYSSLPLQVYSNTLSGYQTMDRATVRYSPDYQSLGLNYETDGILFGGGWSAISLELALPATVGLDNGLPDGFPSFSGTGTFVSLGRMGGVPVAIRYDAFRLSSAVPEPATWGLMIVGFAAVGGALRVRRKEASATALA